MESKRTGLYSIHSRLNARMVEFAGYMMPIQYRGVIHEHNRVRATVGVFDVSHMGEFMVSGDGAADFIQRMTVNDVSTINEYQAQYTAMCYPDGGIVDDLLVYRYSDHYMLVVNAANLQKDFDWLMEHKPAGVSLSDETEGITLLAVQGRDAEATLRKITDVDLPSIAFYHFATGKMAGKGATVSRTGYTGEDGFEIYFGVADSEEVWNAVMEAGQEHEIEPVGLGARDSLRLEMGYCLYGNDIDQSTNPLEAGLGWLTKLGKGDFIGRDTVAAVKEAGVTRRLVGFEMLERAIPRHGYEVVSDGAVVGEVTSGVFSPSLKKGIGMAYVPADLSKPGTEIEVIIRNRHQQALVVKRPFYQRPY